MHQPTEEELAKWLCEQQLAMSKGALDSRQIQMLDTAMPGWNSPVARFHSGAEPPLADGDQAIARWIAEKYAQLDRGTLDHELKQALDEEDPDWASQETREAVNRLLMD